MSDGGQTLHVHNVEEVFQTEGLPRHTFVQPPNYLNILVDMRTEGKPVLVQGPSGVGKTTTVLTIVRELAEFDGRKFRVLSCRRVEDVEFVTKIAYDNLQGNFVIDDFHALEGTLRNRLIQLAKLAADPLAPFRPKLVFIGINGFGATLLEANPEVARRLGRHTVEPGRADDLRKLAQQGLRLLNAEIDNLEEVIATAKGDYWTAQTILKNACIDANVLKTKQLKIKFYADVHKLVLSMVSTLEDQYRPVVMKFCGGLRQRPSNDAYLEFLRGVAPRLHETSFITEVLGSRSPGARAWQRIRDGRLSDHIAKSDQLSRYFFFSTPGKRFLVEEPGLLFYLQHLDWKKLRKRCGLNERPKHHKYDVAISFAGQNRLLAKQLAKILSENDFVVFIDENHEAEMAGRHYYKTFKKVFGKEAAVILPLVDEAYVDRLWTTF